MQLHDHHGATNESAGPPTWILSSFQQQQQQQQYQQQQQPLLPGTVLVPAAASGAAPAAWTSPDGPVGAAPVFAQAQPATAVLLPAGIGISSQTSPPPGSAGNSGTASVQHQQQQQQQQPQMMVMSSQQQQQPGRFVASPPQGLVPVMLANGQQAFVSANSLQVASQQAPVAWQQSGNGPVHLVGGGGGGGGGQRSGNGSLHSVSMTYPTMHDSPGNSTASVPLAGGSTGATHHHQQQRGSIMNASGSSHQQQQPSPPRVKTPPPAPGEDERGPRQLIVNYLPPTASDRDLRQIFSQIGPVEVARISRDSSGASKAFGFVYFRSTDDARRAIESLNGFSWLAKRIKVEWATQRGPHPPGTSRYRPPSVPTGYVPKGPASGSSSLTATSGANGATCMSATGEPGAAVLDGTPSAVGGGGDLGTPVGHGSGAPEEGFPLSLSS